MTKTGPEMRYMGRPIEYKITVSNTGDAPAKDTVLVDTASAAAEFVKASDNGAVRGPGKSHGTSGPWPPGRPSPWM